MVVTAQMVLKNELKEPRSMV